MRTIKPYVKEIVFHVPEGYTIQTWIEKAARNCYKSEDKITNESAAKLIKMLKKRGHHAMLEHASASVHIVGDRGQSHELVRHRPASYAQECLSGNTLIKTGSTTKSIKEIYKRQYDGTCYDKTHNKTLNIKSVSQDNTIVNNKMVDVWHKGKGQTYKVETKLGYAISASENHKFLTTNGFVRLKDLSVGDKVYVNGRPSLIKISDDIIKKMYLVEEKSPQEIANIINTKYRNVINKLKSLGIFESHKNDKNKEKYNKNHTSNSYEKMATTIKEQYKNGRTVWNKGLKEDDHESMKKIAESSRARTSYNKMFGEDNPAWTGGPKGCELARILKKDIKDCELCGSNIKLEVHHKDKNTDNNDFNNIIKVCCKCHNLLHHGWVCYDKAIQDHIISIHEDKIEDLYDIEMRRPYNNFVANGFIVHNSTRYCNYSKGKFGSEITVIEQPDMNSMQTFIWKDTLEKIESAYMTLLKLGCKPEIARSILPIATKAEIVITANLREFMHIFSMRCSKYAHPIIRGIFKDILRKFYIRVPEIFDDLYKEFIED